ncbi:DUF4224 domain-containing protein [Stenoxybacter acetivorans]|uniref:DUF4224 domain-containing protein n=1 Tax=Stenoxybacter acetivorans TaxID=422441 RepID=UPI00055ABDC0|nr:DUF4224 domain-containing protein [Stenoxybacter acetivorans]
MSEFLSREDVVILTGRKRATAQITALRSMGVPYLVNAAGNPVVPVAVITGIFRQPEKISHSGWQSAKVQHG